MKKVFSCMVVLLCLFFAFSSPAMGEGEAFSFRNGVCFGMTKEEVKASEKEQPGFENETSLFYINQKAAGENAKILYIFGELGLEDIGVTFTDLHTNPNLYLDDYDRVYSALCEKYGEPALPKQFVWKSDLFKDLSSDYGILISMGHLQQWALWKFPEYDVGLYLSGENYEIDHGILYQWKSSAEKEVDTSGI